MYICAEQVKVIDASGRISLDLTVDNCYTLRGWQIVWPQGSYLTLVDKLGKLSLDDRAKLTDAGPRAGLQLHFKTDRADRQVLAARYRVVRTGRWIVWKLV